jgi:hypothetical protein
MKKNVHSVRVAVLLALLVLLGADCEYKVPKSVWDPNANLGAQPTIVSIDPNGRAGGGKQTITIKGSGFSADTSKCRVFFGGSAAKIISGSEDQIVVQRPAVTGDSITIKVLVTGAYTIATFPGYAVDQVYRLYGFKALAGLVQWIDVDASENLYGVKITRDLLEILPDESVVKFANNSFKKKCLGMRVGPDGGLYEIELGIKTLHRIAPEGGNSEKYADFPAVPRAFDFDANGNAVSVGDKIGTLLMLTDLSTRTLSVFSDLTPVEVRCYKGQVFVTDGQAIWKTTLSTDYSTAGPKEKVFDMTQAADYAGSSITSFVMDENGGLIVCTDRTGDALFEVSAGGVVGPYYKGILPSYASGQLMWGSGHYLYLNMQAESANRDVLRIDAGRNEAGKN